MPLVRAGLYQDVLTPKRSQCQRECQRRITGLVLRGGIRSVLYKHVGSLGTVSSNGKEQRCVTKTIFHVCEGSCFQEYSHNFCMILTHGQRQGHLTAGVTNVTVGTMFYQKLHGFCLSVKTGPAECVPIPEGTIGFGEHLLVRLEDLSYAVKVSSIQGFEEFLFCRLCHCRLDGMMLLYGWRWEKDSYIVYYASWVGLEFRAFIALGIPVRRCREES